MQNRPGWGEIDSLLTGPAPLQYKLPSTTTGGYSAWERVGSR